jgi:hypothetical protein
MPDSSAKQTAATSSRNDLAIPVGLSGDVQPIAEEVHRIHEAAMWSAQGQFEQMKFWRLANLVLGLPAAALAAISGGTGLATHTSNGIPAVLALIAAGFGAALTTLNPSRRVAQSYASANAYLEVQTSARQLLTIDLPHSDRDSAREALAKLSARRDDINKSADPPNSYARWRAKRNIDGGGQSYAADRSG